MVESTLFERLVGFILGIFKSRRSKELESDILKLKMCHQANKSCSGYCNQCAWNVKGE